MTSRSRQAAYSRPSDNHLAYFRTFPCVDVQNCTISDTKTAVVPPFWRFLKVICLKNSLNVVYFPNSKLPPISAVSLSSASHRAVHRHYVYKDNTAVADSGNTLTGQYAVHCIPVRPRTAHAAAVALFFPEAVELRLRKISGSLAKDIVTAAQFTIFTFQLFQTLTFSGGEPTITAPVSRSCWRTQTRRVSGVQPIFGAMEQIGAHCESYSS